MAPSDLILGILAVMVAWIVYRDLTAQRRRRRSDRRTRAERPDDD